MATTHPKPANALADSLSPAFLTAVLMWCVWALTHLPSLDVHPAVRAALMLGSLISVAFVHGRGGRGSIAALIRGMVMGVVVALLNLLILGSELVEQPAAPGEISPDLSGLRPDALVFMPGFVVFLGALGAAAAAAGRSLMGHSEAAPDPLRRFSIVTCLAFVPLLLIGGLVTTTDSGMAVPDWPNSYGANMFLYPVAMMADPQIFLEHTHRLFGSLLGLTTMAFAILAWARSSSTRLRALVSILFAAVVVQGILGGTRVLADMRGIGAVHGFLAHAIFVFAAGIAAWLLPMHQSVPALRRPARLRSLERLATAALHTTLLQTLVGSIYRHMRLDDSMGKGVGHILYTHMALSLAVVVLAAMAAFRAMSAARDLSADRTKLISRWGWVILATVIAQFMLGWGAFAALAQEAEAWASVVRTLHHGNGAALLAAIGCLFVWSKRVARAPSEGPDPGSP